MKLKVKAEFKAKESAELIKLIKDSEELIFKLGLEKSQNKLKNLRQIFNERKKIALMKTIIVEKSKTQKVLEKKKEVKK